MLIHLDISFRESIWWVAISQHKVITFTLHQFDHIDSDTFYEQMDLETLPLTAAFKD